ncbi:hypothetical protein E2C01_053032 [Portunus trituberculatus]|uniref:Uncharacterized protein n=1 Tax=Portunus trituberculatus TaxID=210409 RepID=A0A5B7GPR0_PORTR|nr:hypothetical protein [Portunus trituberculatus]
MMVVIGTFKALAIEAAACLTLPAVNLLVSTPHFSKNILSHLAIMSLETSLEIKGINIPPITKLWPSFDVGVILPSRTRLPGSQVDVRTLLRYSSCFKLFPDSRQAIKSECSII